MARTDAELAANTHVRVDPTTPGLKLYLDVEGAMGSGNLVPIPDLVPGGFGGISRAVGDEFQVAGGLRF